MADITYQGERPGQPGESTLHCPGSGRAPGSGGRHRADARARWILQDWIQLKMGARGVERVTPERPPAESDP